METTTRKITLEHLKRRAALYIRQSTAQQVLEHGESTRRQYDLKGKLISFGWSADRVDVIDSDLGLSGAESTQRGGFKKLLADVGNGEIGAVACIECSRLSRKTQDWGYLLEICAITNTLLIDADGIYDPNDFNDGILLGLKGTMFAAELHYIKSRMRGGALSMAKRGDYRVPLPVGYIYDAAGSVVKDPNLEVQNALMMLFDGFRTHGSVRKTVRHFNQNGIAFPKNPGNGFYNDEITWIKLNTSRAYTILTNHVYAGTYSYGKKQVVRTVAGSKISPKPPEEWHAYIEGHHEGYISLEEYDKNMVLLSENRIMPNSRGAAREGSALLQGMAFCGKCGSRMGVYYYYQKDKSIPYYFCNVDAIEYGKKTCQSIHGINIDKKLSGIILEKLTPEAILKAIEVQMEIEKREASSDNYYAMKVENAKYKAELARKRFNSVDPDNRLVAFELERLWNQCLEALALAEDERQRNIALKEKTVTKDDVARLLALPVDVKALWESDGVSINDKKRIARYIIEDVTLKKNGQKINIGICFKTGSTVEVEVDNPLRPYEKYVISGTALDIMKKEAKNHNADVIAQKLNEMGIKSATGLKFNERIVLKTMRSNGILTPEKYLKEQGYITLPEKAKSLGVPWTKLYNDVVAGIYKGEYARAGKKGKFMFK